MNALMLSLKTAGMKFNLMILIVLLMLIFNMLPSLAQETTDSVFSVGKYVDMKTAGYDNNMKVGKILSLPGTDELEVIIQGELEKCCESATITTKCCDYITIYDQDEQEIGKYSGQLDEKFILKGNMIRVEFVSDGRTTKQGFEVSITKQLSAKVFNDIKEQLLTLIEQILTFGTQKILSRLQNHLEAFNQLREQISQSTEIEPVVAQIAQKLIAISETYQTIAAMNVEMEQFHQQQFEKLKQLIARTDLYIIKVYDKKERYLKDLEAARSQLATLEDPLEKQKLNYTIDGYSKIEQNLQVQKKLWERFKVSQQGLENSLKTYSQGIDILFHFLKINAQVYQESANLALLGQFSQLKDNLSNQQKLQEIINAIGEAEKNISELIAKIKKLTHSS